jgi:hypothetical protein
VLDTDPVPELDPPHADKKDAAMQIMIEMKVLCRADANFFIVFAVGQASSLFDANDPRYLQSGKQL